MTVDQGDGTSVNHGGLPAYRLRRSSRARRPRITISENGEAVVVLPLRAPERAAAELVARHAGWIERHVERIGFDRRALAQRPPLADGRTLSVEGVPFTIVVERAPRGRRRASVDHDPAGRIVNIVTTATDSRSVAAILEGWLRGVARRRIAERVAARAAEMRVVPASVAIRDQRTRWGSASPRGALSFNWRLVLCPPHVLDYVVVHELAHLRVSGHSPRFWALVEKHAGNPAAARQWLRANHAELRHALD